MYTNRSPAGRKWNLHQQLTMNHNFPRLLHVLPAFLIIVSSMIIIFSQVKNQPSTTDNSQLTTIGWQTYTNADYAFEVKYPPNFQVDENFSTPETFRVSLSPVNLVQPTAISINKSGDLELFKLLSSLLPSQSTEKNLIVYTKIRNSTIGSLPAIEYRADYSKTPIDPPPLLSEILVKSSDFLVHFQLIGPPAAQKNLATLHSILSTFKFLEK